MNYDCTVIDGSGLIYRAYYGYPKLSRFDGIEIGALYGFCSMLLNVIKHETCSYCAIVFDSGRKTFRNEMYSEYKANRTETPADLIQQFALIKDAATLFGAKVIPASGVEADDVIASICNRISSHNKTVKIVSSDKDLMQLVSNLVHVYDPAKSKTFTKHDVFDKFGVLPNQLCDFLALVGDASDNVPGVKGIGPKTAAKLIGEFFSVDAIYENLYNIPEKIRMKLIASKDDAFLSKKLVNLNSSIDINIDDLSFDGITYTKIYDFCIANGFRSLAKKMTSK